MYTLNYAGEMPFMKTNSRKSAVDIAKHILADAVGLKLKEIEVKRHPHVAIVSGVVATDGVASGSIIFIYKA